MLGKKKCKILKEIRQRIADENDIPYVTRECTHRGECAGTCPRCEAELRYLERELEKRRALGKSVTVAALCAVTAIGAAGCTPQVEHSTTGITPAPTETESELAGNLIPAPEDEVLEGEFGEGEATLGEAPEDEIYELAGEPMLAEEAELGGKPMSGDEENLPEHELMGDVAYVPEESDG